jgi:3-phosphoshikimate 1-carboxyvinyltransferase
MTTLVVRGGASVEGAATVPGDKSISHRALMLAAVADGESVLRGLASGDDVASTRSCLESFGVGVRDDDGAVRVLGSSHWRAPEGVLDCGNSGTTMRLLAGLAAHHSFLSVLDGDASLRARPMDRVARPLARLGARVDAREGRYPPLSVSGGGLRGARVETEVASAQVKSCVLLAALAAEGETVVREPVPTRDHTERMLSWLGVPCEERDASDGGREVGVRPFRPRGFEIEVPGDPSSAAFLVAAALLCGDVTVAGVCLNPTRTAFYDVCARMGGRLELDVEAQRAGEPVGSVAAHRSVLRGVSVGGPVVALLLDEVPLLAVLAAAAEGTTVVTGARELRVKESDRIAAMTTALRKMGADIDERDDGLEVHGPADLAGADVDACGDHRVAMALAVAALHAGGETRIAGFEAASVSWPGFERTLSSLGANVRTE